MQKLGSTLARRRCRKRRLNLWRTGRRLVRHVLLGFVYYGS